MHLEVRPAGAESRTANTNTDGYLKQQIKEAKNYHENIKILPILTEESDSLASATYILTTMYRNIMANFN